MYRVSDGEALYEFITSWSDATAATTQCNAWRGTQIFLWRFDENVTSVCASARHSRGAVVAHLWCASATFHKHYL